MFNGTDDNALPIPATYVAPDSTHRVDPADILDVLETLVSA
ncbi:hypothetical protein ACGFY3_38860 [Streptomyces mirabilis]